MPRPRRKVSKGLFALCFCSALSFHPDLISCLCAPLPTHNMLRPLTCWGCWARVQSVKYTANHTPAGPLCFKRSANKKGFTNRIQLGKAERRVNMLRGILLGSKRERIYGYTAWNFHNFGSDVFLSIFKPSACLICDNY
jgi:hypothetical protein